MRPPGRCHPNSPCDVPSPVLYVTVSHMLSSFVTAVSAAALLSSGWAAAPDPGGDVPDSPFWVNPDTRAARQAAAWEARGREGDAALLRRIAYQPTATWVGDRDPEAEVRRITVAAAYQDRIPVIAAYDIPHRDCGYYSEGGAPTASAYRRWIRRLAAGIEDRKALVILEPDAVAQLVAGFARARSWTADGSNFSARPSRRSRRSRVRRSIWTPATRGGSPTRRSSSRPCGRPGSATRTASP